MLFWNVQQYNTLAIVHNYESQIQNINNKNIRNLYKFDKIKQNVSQSH